MKSLLSIFVISVCVGAYFVYIKPLSLEVKALGAKKAEYEDVLNKVKEIKEKRDAVLVDYDSISIEDIDKLNKIIPEELDSVGLLNNLNNIASSYGITIKQFKAVAPDSSNRGEIVAPVEEIYKKTLINISASGEYSNFLEFLDRVESSLTLIDVVDVDMKKTSSSARAGSTLLDYTLEANTYSLR